MCPVSSSFYCSSIFGHWGTSLCSAECVSRYVPLAEEADTPLCVCVVCGWARACLARSFHRTKATLKLLVSLFYILSISSNYRNVFQPHW